MKRIYSGLLLFFLAFSSFSQSGTIRVAKPVQKDSVKQAVKVQYSEALSAGTNYTFKGIDKAGYEIEVLFERNNFVYGGIKYSSEFEYFPLQPYNKVSHAPDISIPNSVNHLSFIKIPIGLTSHLQYGNRGLRYLYLGLSFEYLLKADNEYARLSYADYNNFNLALDVRICFPFRKQHYSFNICYSRDLLNNLKDNTIYNEFGAAVGKQKSKTNLLSLSLSYRFPLN